jgi:uroporphyrinogen-III decarboxylase
MVRLHICGNTRPLLEDMGKLGCEIIDLDSMAPLAEARAAMGDDQVLTGNLDPVRALRDSSPEKIHNAIAECHRQAGARYIVAAGCEVPRDTPDENMRAMCEYAKQAIV